ncbi:hypothetical protein [Streptomyces sp. NPDC003635]
MTRGVLARRIATALGAGAAACALSLGGASVADAKIVPVDTQCTNKGGNQPGGQQPSCGGAGLIQESENQNPAGHAPPGHN